MKVRWTHESLRLRITPTELRSLLDGEGVCERFEVAGKAVWEIALMPTEGQTHLTTDSSSVRVAVSKSDRQRLAAPDREGLYFAIEKADGGSVALLR